MVLFNPRAILLLYKEPNGDTIGIMLNMAQIPGYYTINEAAAVMGKTPVMVRRYVKHGYLQSKRIGTQHLIEQADVHRFVPPPRGNPNFQKK
jgi:excisionase family DNA binding protein